MEVWPGRRGVQRRWSFGDKDMVVWGLGGEGEGGGGEDWGVERFVDFLVLLVE